MVITQMDTSPSDVRSRRMFDRVVDQSFLHLHLLRRLVGLSFVDFLIGFAGGADTGFQFLDEPEDESLLFCACALAERTFKALSGQLAILLSDSFGIRHWFQISCLPPEPNHMGDLAAHAV